MLRRIKKEIRILGIDDAPFDKTKKKRKVLVVGTVFRGGEFLDGILSTKVMQDGKDSTSQLVNLIKKTRHLQQLQCIMLDGIALGGFNVVDINLLAEKTRLPVIVIMRKLPNMEKIKSALELIKQKNKMEIIKKAGKIYNTKVRGKNVYFQKANISEELAEKIIKTSTTHSLIPEPLRISHLISTGIVLGESKGRA